MSVCARAVNGTDLKSVVETLVGSNPTGRVANANRSFFPENTFGFSPFLVLVLPLVGADLPRSEIAVQLLK